MHPEGAATGRNYQVSPWFSPVYSTCSVGTELQCAALRPTTSTVLHIAGCRVLMPALRPDSNCQLVSWVAQCKQSTLAKAQKAEHCSHCHSDHISDVVFQTMPHCASSTSTGLPSTRSCYPSQPRGGTYFLGVFWTSCSCKSPSTPFSHRINSASSTRS